jgi:tetratricopeptide (TPR) repeat protein
MEEQLKKILNYLFGEMSADENRLFELELDNDQKLRAALQFVKEIDEVLADHDPLRFAYKIKKVARQYKLLSETDQNYEVTMPEIMHLMQEVDNQAINEEEFAEAEQSLEKSQTDIKIEPSVLEFKRVGIRQMRIGKKVFAAAAVVLVLMISSVTYRSLTQNSDSEIFTSYYQPYNYYIVSSRLAGTSNDILHAAHLYKKGNYKEALNQLQHVIKVDPKNKAVHFFMGISFLELKDFDKATENLMFVINQKDIFYTMHAEWYLALCYLAMGQTNNASDMLCRVAVSDNFYKSKALEILKKIK